MKTPTLKSTFFACASALLALVATAAPTPPGGGSAPVIYAPTAKVIQGNQPLSESYTLTITSPSNLPANTPVTVGLVPTVLSKPAGVADGIALGFISCTPASLAFTGPNQSRTLTVTINVPLGDFAGNYAYNIKPAGWPASLAITDVGATVNALVSPAAATDNTPPSVVLQTPAAGTIYTYYPATGVPVSVPLTFEGTVGTGGNPITGLQAFLNDSPVTIATAGIGTLDATGTATLSLSTPGLYHIRVAATNQDGTSEDNADITVVVSAPPPVITVGSPTANSAFTFPVGGPGVTLPVSYTATSLYGNIISTGSTLNGSPILLSLSGVGTSLIATGSASLSINSPGNYYLNFTAANDYGNATPVTVPFNVASVTPVPTVTVLTPAAGTVYTRTVGDPATAVNYTFSGGTNFGAVQSVTVTVDGAVVAATVTGLNTAAITGAGSLSYSAGGTHVLSVTLSDGISSATDSTSFTVNEQAVPPPAEVCENLTWLPPISLNKTVEGGCTMPIKFRLDCGRCNFVRDETVLISIYEINADGSMTTPVIYPYGGANPNPPGYAINGNHYQLNFPTADGVHRYRIEVYHPLTADGSSLQLLGTKDLLTKEGKRCDDRSDHDGHHGRCDDDKGGKSSKSGKSYDHDKSSKSSKSHDGKYCDDDRSSKGGKSSKSGKSYEHDKSSKSSKSHDGKYGDDDRSSKGDKSSKSGKSYEHDKSSKSSKSDNGKYCDDDRSSKGGKSSKSGKSYEHDKSSKSGKSDNRKYGDHDKSSKDSKSGKDDSNSSKGKGNGR